MRNIKFGNRNIKAVIGRIVCLCAVLALTVCLPGGCRKKQENVQTPEEVTVVTDAGANTAGTDTAGKDTAGTDTAGKDTADGSSADGFISGSDGATVQEKETKKPEKCTEHADIDDNGLCDNCGESVIVTVDLYAINDLHGKFRDTENQPGLDELTTYLMERNMTDDHAIFLSSGDMWQGSAESNLTRGAILIDWMNEMGFVSMTLGNHEFDWGEEYLEYNSGLADFPFLAINVYSTETDSLVSYCTPSVMVDLGEVQIGIIGAIGDCYSSIAADKTEGFYIITGYELTDLVKKESERLRAEGADFIVYSLHDGYDGSFGRTMVIPDIKFSSYYNTVLSAGYVDLVFEGHTHQSYVLMDTKGVYHLQDGGENDGISHVTVDINTANGNDNVAVAEFVDSGVYVRSGSNSLRDELLDKYSDQIAFALDVLGVSSSYYGRDELRSIIAEQYYRYGMEEWGSMYDIVLGGAYMSCRSPGHIQPGDVTYADIQELFPFDNELVLCSIRGADLLRVFITNPSPNYFMYFGEYGVSIIGSVDPNATYYVVTDTYSSTYEPNNLTEISRLGEELYARDMLAEYVRAGGLGK